MHKKIRTFFHQFRRGKNYADVRRALYNSAKTARSAVTDLERPDILNIDGTSEDRSSADKMTFLREYRDFLSPSTVTRLTTELRSFNYSSKLSATKQVGQLLSIVEVFKSPSEKRKLAADIYKIYEVVIEQGWAPILQEGLWSGDTELVYESMRAIYYLSPGPRIASTPENSPLHPRNMFFKKLILNPETFNALMNQLTVGAPPNREMAIVCLS